MNEKEKDVRASLLSMSPEEYNEYEKSEREQLETDKKEAALLGMTLKEYYKWKKENNGNDKNNKIEERIADCEEKMDRD